MFIFLKKGNPMLWPLFKKQEGLDSLEFIFPQAVPTTPTASYLNYLPERDADTEKRRMDTAGGWVEGEGGLN